MEWVSAPVITSKALVHTEQEAAETLLGPMGSTGLGEKKPSAAFLSKRALGLRLLPLGEFNLPESIPRN